MAYNDTEHNDTCNYSSALNSLLTHEMYVYAFIIVHNYRYHFTFLCVRKSYQLCQVYFISDKIHEDSGCSSYMKLFLADRQMLDKTEPLWLR